MDLLHKYLWKAKKYFADSNNSLFYDPVPPLYICL